MNGNIVLAVVGGIIAAAIGAAIWAGVTVATGYQIGWMAVGVGFVVGVAVRTLGQGSGFLFGATGAGFALVGCVLGNILSSFGFIAREESVSFVQVLTHFDYTLTFALLAETFHPMDALFYILAIGAGFTYGQVADGGVEGVAGGLG